MHKVVEFKFCLNSNSFVLFELVCFSKKEKERKIRAQERNPVNPKPQPGPAQTALENPTQIPQAGPFLSLKPVGRPTLCLLSFLPVRPSKQPSRPASSLPPRMAQRARSAQPSVSALRVPRLLLTRQARSSASALPSQRLPFQPAFASAL